MDTFTIQLEIEKATTREELYWAVKSIPKQGSEHRTTLAKQLMNTLCDLELRTVEQKKEFMLKLLRASVFFSTY